MNFTSELKTSGVFRARVAVMLRTVWLLWLCSVVVGQGQHVSDRELMERAGFFHKGFYWGGIPKIHREDEFYDCLSTCSRTSTLCPDREYVSPPTEGGGASVGTSSSSAASSSPPPSPPKRRTTPTSQNNATYCYVWQTKEDADSTKATGTCTCKKPSSNRRYCAGYTCDQTLKDLSNCGQDNNIPASSCATSILRKYKDCDCERASSDGDYCAVWKCMGYGDGATKTADWTCTKSAREFYGETLPHNFCWYFQSDQYSTEIREAKDCRCISEARGSTLVSGSGSKGGGFCAEWVCFQMDMGLWKWWSPIPASLVGGVLNLWVPFALLKLNFEIHAIVCLSFWTLATFTLIVFLGGLVSVIANLGALLIVFAAVLSYRWAHIEEYREKAKRDKAAQVPQQQGAGNCEDTIHEDDGDDDDEENRRRQQRRLQQIKEKREKLRQQQQQQQQQQQDHQQQRHVESPHNHSGIINPHHLDIDVEMATYSPSPKQFSSAIFPTRALMTPSSKGGGAAAVGGGRGWDDDGFASIVIPTAVHGAILRRDNNNNNNNNSSSNNNMDRKTPPQAPSPMSSTTHSSPHSLPLLVPPAAGAATLSLSPTAVQKNLTKEIEKYQRELQQLQQLQRHLEVQQNEREKAEKKMKEKQRRKNSNNDSNSASGGDNYSVPASQTSQSHIILDFAAIGGAGGGGGGGKDSSSEELKLDKIHVDKLRAISAAALVRGTGAGGAASVSGGGDGETAIDEHLAFNSPSTSSGEV